MILYLHVGLLLDESEHVSLTFSHLALPRRSPSMQSGGSLRAAEPRSAEKEEESVPARVRAGARGKKETKKARGPRDSRRVGLEEK